MLLTVACDVVPRVGSLVGVLVVEVVAMVVAVVAEMVVATGQVPPADHLLASQ